MTNKPGKEQFKQKDIFIGNIEKSVVWFDRYRSIGIKSLLLMLVLLVAFLGHGYWQDKKRANANNTFAKAWKILGEQTADHQPNNNPNDNPNHTIKPIYSTQQEQWTAAKEPLQQTIRMTQWHGVGVVAGLLLADIEEKLGDHTEAERVLMQLQSKLGVSDHLYFLVAERLAYLREGQQDIDGALNALSDLTKQDTYFYADHAKLHEARLFLLKKDPERARSILENLSRTHPNALFTEDVDMRLREINQNATSVPKAVP